MKVVLGEPFKFRFCPKRASTDEDGRLRTVNPSIRPYGQRTKIWAQTVPLMDEFGRQTMIICPRWTEVDGGRRQTVHVMDGFRRRTIKNIKKMWTEVDGWTDGRKSVRRGLVQSASADLGKLNNFNNCH